MTLVRPGGELLGDLRHSLENTEVGCVCFIGVVPLTQKINRQAKIKAIQLAATTLLE